MSNKTINDLRASLFTTIEQLQSGKIEIDRAKAISEVAGRIIESAKVKVEFQRVTGQDTASTFLPVTNQSSGGDTPTQQTSTLPPGITGVRQHRLKG